MAEVVARPRFGTPEAEKITINVGAVDLGQIDPLVQEAFYSNRTDFIRTAIQNQLASHADTVKQTVARKMPPSAWNIFRKSGSRARSQSANSCRSRCWAW